MSPARFIAVTVLVLQVLTLFVQFATTALMFVFRNRNVGFRAASRTLATGERIKAVGRNNNKQTWLSRSFLRGVRPRLLRFALAPSSVAVALITSLFVRRVFHISHPLAWFLAAILATVWYGGLGPGLIALILSMLAVAYFILPPLHSFSIAPSEVWYLFGFVFWCLLSIWFSSKRRGAEEALKRIATAWRRRWEGTAELLEKNAQLQHEISDLRERLRKLEDALRQSGSLSA